MKAIAINLILAQTIETAVAAEFKYVPDMYIVLWLMLTMYYLVIATS